MLQSEIFPSFIESGGVISQVESPLQMSVSQKKKQKTNSPMISNGYHNLKNLKTKFYANGLRPLMPLEQCVPKRNKCPSVEHYPTCEDL